MTKEQINAVTLYDLAREQGVKLRSGVLLNVASGEKCVACALSLLALASKGMQGDDVTYSNRGDILEDVGKLRLDPFYAGLEAGFENWAFGQWIKSDAHESEPVVKYQNDHPDYKTGYDLGQKIRDELGFRDEAA